MSLLSHNDSQLLQNDLNNVYEYGQRLCLKFSFEDVLRSKHIFEINILVFLLLVICYWIPL